MPSPPSALPPSALPPCAAAMPNAMPNAMPAVPESRFLARWAEQADQPAEDDRVFIAVLDADGCLEVTVEAAERR
jgi:hypothetical protein